MNEELQATDTDQDENIETNEDVNEAEGQGEVSESAPEDSKVVFDERQQAKVDDIVNKKVKATHEARRESEDLKRQLEEAKAKIPQAERPDVPAVPDPYDAEYEQKIRSRDEAVKKRAEFDANKAAQQSANEQQQRQADQQQQAKLNEVLTTYTGRAKGLGITNDELQVAGNTLQQQGISGDLALHILQDDKGPAITKYLADNPLAFDEVRGMNSMQAAIHIETNIKPNVGGKKATTAPPPETTLDGGGTTPTKRGPAGSTFE